MPKVSIIVPVYNVERYVGRCLETLVNQTLYDIEIIIVNDGSTDGSKLIIEKYMKKNPFKIKYFEKENGGLSSARNFGLNHATGEYIAFLDSDDYVQINMYEKMYETAKKEDADMVECDFLWEWEEVLNNNENGNNKPSKTKKDTRRDYKNKREMMKKPRVVAWNKLIRRNIIKERNIKFPEGLIYEDIEFFYKIIPFINKISYVNKYFVHYIQRENSISNLQSVKNADIFKILDNIDKFYIEKGLFYEYKEELKYIRRRIIFGSSMKRILKIKDKKLRRRLFWQSIKQGVKKTTVLKCEKDKLKICFGITKLGIGGAERVLVDMANELVKDGKYNITIFTIYGGGELEKELNKNITIKSMYDKEKRSKLIPIYILICGKNIYNKYLKDKYNIEISFLEGPITRIFSYGNNNITWVHNDIDKVFGNSFKANIKKYIDRYFYKKYEKIVFVSKQNKKSFENVYGNISDRKLIYNYINKDRIIEKASTSDRKTDLKYPEALHQHLLQSQDLLNKRE